MTFRAFIIAFILFAAAPAAAQGEAAAPEPQFFSALQDVPLMPGMREVAEMTVVFDKPEGRIVESAAALQGQEPGRAALFYAQTLPQLGWRKAGENTYARQGEVLQLAFEGDSLMRVMVRPD